MTSDQLFTGSAAGAFTEPGPFGVRKLKCSTLLFGWKYRPPDDGSVPNLKRPLQLNCVPCGRIHVMTVNPAFRLGPV